jgi:uncharacterized membrane protein YphA (DoxX/SURF4 family)
MIPTIKVLAQLIVGLGLLNVWLLRFNRQTAYRGGSAQNMRQEFASYGLPSFSLYLVGGLKILASLLLLAGIWIPELVLPAAAVVCVLMVGALAMHFKVSDPLKKSVPALAVFLLSLGLCLTSI